MQSFPTADWRLHRKSAFVLANQFRKNSRNSVSSNKQQDSTCTYLFGQDLKGINLFPFKNDIRGASANQNTFRSKSQKKSFINKLSFYFQTFYEKSQFHYILPIIILVIYSFLGGFIFYTIESPEEQKVLLRKKEYVEYEENVILQEVLAIEQRFHALYLFYNTSKMRHHEVRRYRNFAMNRLNKAVYWYVLQVYYLNDQEIKKSSVLHPSNPERIWRTHFSSSFGRIIALKNYTQQLSDRCWEIGIEMNSPTIARVKLKRSIEEFNTFTGLQHVLTPTWTFWNSMFLAVTTYSTIGYGNITPKSRLGKLAAMVYALIGIPLMLMILHKLGRFFLLCLERLWDGIVWFMQFVSCVKNAEKLKGKVSAEERKFGRMPVTIAIGIAFSWMFLCAAIFLKFEKDWDYFKSFYFFFCSLTTIGYGDVTPTNSEDMFIIFGFIIVGLSLVSMCINVIQLKLEELLEDLLLSMIEEYDAQGDGLRDPQVTPKMDVVDLWKVWKKRRERRPKLQRPTIPTPEGFSGSTDKITNVSAAASQRLNLGAFSRIHRLPPDKFSDLNLRKIFPFAKRRRELLLHEIQSRYNQQTKSTQTDFGNLYNINPAGYMRGYDEPNRRSSPLSNCVSDRTENLDSFPPSIVTTNTTANESTSTLSFLHKKLQLTVSTSSDHSSLSPVFGGSSYAKRYLPSRNDRSATQCFSAAYSIRSAPNTSCFYPNYESSFIGDNIGANVFALTGNNSNGGVVESVVPSQQRRWTFFEISKTPRGGPRGLSVPYMYTKRCAKIHETTEIKRLIAEIDSRLVDCHSLAASCSSRTSTSEIIKK